MAASKGKKVVKLHEGAKNTEQIDRYLSRIRQLSSDSERFQTDMMFALAELHEHREVWSVRYSTWDTLLTEEGFTTGHSFEWFIKGLDIFGVAEVRNIGSRAAISLALQTVPIRSRVLKSTKAWIETHGVKPSYQRISGYVRKEIGSVKPKKVKLKSRRNADSRDEIVVGLKAKVRELQANLRESEDKLSKAEKKVWLLKSELKKRKIPLPKGA
jgi:hypothetical protein